jgi:hypothetical protein
MSEPSEEQKPDRKIDKPVSFLGIPLEWWSCVDSGRRVVIIRLALGIVLAAAGLLLFGIGASRWLAGLFHMLVGMILLVGSAACFGAVFSRKCAVTVSNLLFPDKHFSRSQPVYSHFESLRMKGRHQEAIDGFLEIAEEYPEEVTPWMYLIDIAFKDLRDPDRARTYFHDALTRLENEPARRKLGRLYRSHLECFGDRALLDEAEPAGRESAPCDNLGEIDPDTEN